MEGSVVDRVRGANMKLRALLFHTREALAGRGNFTSDHVRAIADPVSRMAPIVAEANRLRTIHPDLDGELEAYAGNLNEMQTALEQMRFMLIARRASLEAMRGHVETLGMWTAALRSTQ
jgi:hypothetical protein